MTPIDPTKTDEIKALEEVACAARDAAKLASQVYEDAQCDALKQAMEAQGIEIGKTRVVPWVRSWNGNRELLEPGGKSGATYVVTGVNYGGYIVKPLTKAGIPSRAGAGLWRSVVAVTKADAQ